MANRCFTEYRITSKNGEARKILDKINTAPRDMWNQTDLVDVAHTFGYLSDQVGGRGVIDYMNLINEDCLEISTDTAWSPCNELFWRIKIDNPDIRMCYTAILDGEIFGDDMDYPQYILDSELNDDWVYFKDDKEVFDFFNKTFDEEARQSDEPLKTIDEVREFIDEYADDGLGVYMNLMEYDYIPIESSF